MESKHTKECIDAWQQLKHWTLNSYNLRKFKISKEFLEDHLEKIQNYISEASSKCAVCLSEEKRGIKNMDAMQRLRKLAELKGAESARSYLQEALNHKTCVDGEVCSLLTNTTSILVKAHYAIPALQSCENFMLRLGMFKDDPFAKDKIREELVGLFYEGFDNKIVRFKIEAEDKKKNGRLKHCLAL